MMPYEEEMQLGIIGIVKPIVAFGLG